MMRRRRSQGELLFRVINASRRVLSQMDGRALIAGRLRLGAGFDGAHRIDQSLHQGGRQQSGDGYGQGSQHEKVPPVRQSVGVKHSRNMARAKAVFRSGN